MGNNLGNSFFTPSTKQYPAQSMPVWLEVKERKHAGGTVDISGYKDGDIIPAGIAVNLSLMGGTAILLDAFEVQSNVAAADGTSLVLKSISGALYNPSGLTVGKVNETTGIASKAATLGDGVEGTGDDKGKFTFTITAGSLGALSSGDLLYIIKEAGSNKAMVKPTGLSWRQIVVDADGVTPTFGTVAVVTKGQVLADRIPAISEFFKSMLPGITFEYERNAND